MSIRDFGHALLETNDLDPIYVAIYQAQLDEPQLSRLLLAYWMFYHLGVASRLSEHEGLDYWMMLKKATADKDRQWPRASERRHFRGDKAVQAVVWLAEHFDTPESPVRRLAQHTRAEGIAMEMQKWPQFGVWIMFKAADMIERVYGRPIVFANNVGMLYESPRAGLRLVAEERNASIEDVYHNLMFVFRDQPAPPDRKRPCGPQEIETICCKYYSYRQGHYHIGNDIIQMHRALEGWGATAERLLEAAPPMIW